MTSYIQHPSGFSWTKTFFPCLDFSHHHWMHQQMQKELAEDGASLFPAII